MPRTCFWCDFCVNFGGSKHDAGEWFWCDLRMTFGSFAGGQGNDAVPSG